jgi:dTDP-4-dehydrorhamnose reductase
MLQQQDEPANVHVMPRQVRMENREDVARVLDDVKPTHVINCAGITGR